MEPAKLAPGQVVAGRYQIGRFLGRGEMGEVYETRDSQSGRTFALKVLFREIGRGAEHVLLFRGEAQRLAALGGDSLCKVYDVQPDPETRAPYVLEDLIESPSLEHIVSTQGPLPLAAVEGIVRSLAIGLEAAHHAAVVHRGLKPTNVFASQTATGWVAKITDFGMAGMRAAAPDPQVSPIQPLVPPEQAQGGAPAPTMDVWTLGALVFHALTGRSPFVAASRSPLDTNQLWAEINAPFASASKRAQELGASLPAALDPWFSRALAPNPADRFPNVREMAQSFTQVAAAAAAAPAVVAAGFPATAAVAAPAPAGGGGVRNFKGTLMMGQQSPFAAGGPAAGAPPAPQPPGPPISKPEIVGAATEAFTAPPFAFPDAGGSGYGAPPAHQPLQPAAQQPATPLMQGAPSAIARPAPPPIETAPPPAPAKKKSPVLLIVGILGALVVLGGIAVAAVMMLRPSSAPETTAATAETTTKPPADTASATAEPPAPAVAAPGDSASAAPPSVAAPDTDVLVTFACDPGCDEVACDGTKVDDAVAGVRLKPGKHVCVGKKDGYLDKGDSFTVKLGTDVKRSLTLKKKPDAPTGTPGNAPPPKKEKCGTFINPCK